MYIWVVIATFITILYSYNISVRSDLDRVFAESKASVVLNKFYAQHRGVLDYVYSQSPKHTGESRARFYPGSGLYILKEEGDTSDAQQFEPTDIEPYVPIGYVLPSGDEESSTVSKVFCFDAGDTDKQCVSNIVDGSCCETRCIAEADDDDCATTYVVSFKQISPRWINKTSNLPNTDMMRSFVRVTGYGQSFGYTMTAGGKLVLSGGHKVQEYDDGGNPVGDETMQYREIYKAIAEDKDFQRLGCDDEDKHCLFAIDQLTYVVRRN